MPSFPKPISRAQERKVDKREAETRWQQVRREVLARDNFRCRFCGTPELVEVHHLKPRSLGREDSMANCLALCAPHHRDRHAYRLFIIGDDANKRLRFEKP